MRNTEIIQGLYAAFGQGDIPTILGQIADEVDWSYDSEAPGHERFGLLRQCHTPAEVAEKYFAFVGTQMEFHRFEPKQFFEDGNDVIVILDVGFTAVPTGKKVELEEIHHFTLEDGKIVRYRPFLDTATVLAAYDPD